MMIIFALMITEQQYSHCTGLPPKSDGRDLYTTVKAR